MFDLTMFPAEDGDCLLLSYGDAAAPRHTLVDGGRGSCFRRLKPRLLDMAARGMRLELLVLTHIDSDHIEGLLSLVDDDQVWPLVGDVWFNGYEQLSTFKVLSVRQADRYSKALAGRGSNLNRQFGGGAVCLNADGSPRIVTLDSGLKLTILSPGRTQLERLRAAWEKEREEAERKAAQEPELQVGQWLSRIPPIDVELLAAETETADRTVWNGSSIAFLAEWDGGVAMMGADAHPAVLQTSLASLGQGGPVPIDLYKVAHHGSTNNTSRALLAAMSCNRFALSTDGSRHEHPDRDTIAKLIKAGERARRGGEKTELFFNYRSIYNEVWDDQRLKEMHGYETNFPGAHAGGGLDVRVRRD